MDPLAADLAARGWDVANIEYRRVGRDGGYPETLEDATAAVSFAVRETSARKRIVLIGHSVGGELALLNARQAHLVLALSPVTDVRRTFDEGLGEDAAIEFIGATPEENPMLTAWHPRDTSFPSAAPSSSPTGSTTSGCPPHIPATIAMPRSATVTASSYASTTGCLTASRSTPRPNTGRPRSNGLPVSRSDRPLARQVGCLDAAAGFGRHNVTTSTISLTLCNPRTRAPHHRIGPTVERNRRHRSTTIEEIATVDSLRANPIAPVMQDQQAGVVVPAGCSRPLRSTI